MNRLSKIFLFIIIILVIALGVMTYIARRNQMAYVDAATQIYELVGELEKYRAE